MNRSIKELEKEIVELLDKKQQLEDKLSKAILDTITNIVKEHPMQRLGNNIFVIKFSDLMGNPWNPSFYDWEKSAQIIFKFLQSKPATEWRSALQKKLDEKHHNGCVIFEFRSSFMGLVSVNKIPVSEMLIRKIIEAL